MKIAIYPGTFDPVTNGHIDIIERAAQLFDKLIVGVFDNISKRITFSKQERVMMIKESIHNIENAEVEAFDGLLVDFARQKEAKYIVRGLRAISDFEFELSLALTNCSLSPDIETIFFMTNKDFLFISSSLVKEIAMLGGDVKGKVPDIAAKMLYKKFNIKRS